MGSVLGLELHEREIGTTAARDHFTTMVDATAAPAREEEVSRGRDSQPSADLVARNTECLGPDLSVTQVELGSEDILAPAELSDAHAVRSAYSHADYHKAS